MRFACASESTSLSVPHTTWVGHGSIPSSGGLDIWPDIDEHEAARSLCVLRGIDHGDDAAHRGAAQDKPINPELIGERGEVAGLIGILICALGRPGALAMAAHIYRDDMG